MTGIFKNPNKVIKDISKDWCIENIESIAPAVIVSVSDYETDRTIDVLPLIMEKQSDGDILVPDTIYKVPVILQAQAEGVFSIPPTVGGKALIGYAKRSIEEFTFGSNTDQYLPEDKRVFGSTDAVVLGYYGQAGKEVGLSINDALWIFKDARITLDKDSSVKIQSTDEYYHEIKSDGNITETNGVATVTKNPDGTITIFNETSTILMQPDGTVSITNTSGSGELKASGEWDLNGATVTTGGNVITASGTDLDALQAAYNSHIHDKTNSIGTATPPIPTA